MKVDVVVCFYRQGLHWDKVAWGLNQNREHINSVLLVNDEKTDIHFQDWTHDLLVPFRYLDHEHDGFGLTTSVNQGVAEAQTEFVLLIEGDEILAPNSLAETVGLALPDQLLCGRKQYARIDVQLEDLKAWAKGENPAGSFIIESDHRLKWGPVAASRIPWAYCSGGHLLIHKPHHEKIGGFNESWKEYGYHDYDYAVRWLTAGGTIDYGGGYIIHIGSGKGREGVSPEGQAMLARSLASLRNGRYHLGCGEKFEHEMVNVDLVGGAAEVFLDCAELDWMEDGSATHIQHAHFIEHLPIWQVKRHLAAVWDKLKPGGTFKIEFPDVLKCAKEYAENESEEALMGLYGNPVHQLEGALQVHKWGWSSKSLSDLVKKMGFSIDVITEPDNDNAWRDTVIEASKRGDEEEV